MPGLISVIGGILALLSLLLAFRNLKRKRLIDDLPTSKTQGVFIGQTELKGTAESDSPFTSFLAAKRCVYYRWHVEEEWRRTVTTSSSDSKGHTTTSTHTETGWTVVAQGKESAPFYLKDDTGIVRVVPEGATINDTVIFDQNCTPIDPLYYAKGPAAAIANSTHKRRFRETALLLHTPLYIMGHARERQDVAAAEVAEDKRAPMYLISVKTERQISSSYHFWFWFFTALGLLLAMGGTLTAVIMGTGSSLYGIIAGCFAAALVIGWVWTVYNSLVNLEHMAEQGWSEVDIQLKRRYDLIPNLESIVKGYRDYENETLKVLTELRVQGEATPPGVPGPDFKGIFPMLRIVGERYPELKASESFLSLQKTLADTEQRIALARDYYNSTATFYNTRLQIIPDRFVAGIGRMRPKSLMGAADFERAAVEVKLAD